MDQGTLQIAARITVHEFLLEILFARWIADQPNPLETAQKAGQEYLRLVRKESYPAPDVPVLSAEEKQILDEECVHVMERFVEKMCSRVESILDQEAQGRDRPQHEA